MSRISQVKAEKLASELLKKNKQAQKELIDKFDKTLALLYMEKVPLEIKEIWKDKELKKYIDVTSYPCVTCERFSNDKISGNYRGDTYPEKDVPMIIADEDYIKLEKLKDEVEKGEKEYSILWRELYAVLYNLRTPKKIIESFPSLKDSKIINSPVKMELINLDHLKSRIKK